MRMTNTNKQNKKNKKKHDMTKKNNQNDTLAKRLDDV